MRNYLRKYKVFQKINAAIKSKIMELELARLEKKYRSSASINHPKKINVTVNKILWIGGNYDQDHSGFIQSLKNFAEVVTYTNIDGKYGLLKQPKNSKKIIFDDIRDIHKKSILNLVKNENIDLVMGQMWASTIDPEMLIEIRGMGIPCINIAMDDKLPYHWKKDKKNRRNGAIGLASSVDITLNTTKSATDWYNYFGYNALYWPLAGNQNVFYPRKNKKYDVVFIGSKYGYRGELIENLIKLGIKIETFGPGWPNGPCSANESADIFGSAKIILGIGYIGHSKRLVTLKQRDFDALFTGSLYITSRNPDLEKILQDKKHIIYFDNEKDLAEKIKFYLRNDNERSSIAKNALEEGLKMHTWDKRLNNTFNEIGIKFNKELNS